MREAARTEGEAPSVLAAGVLRGQLEEDEDVGGGCLKSLVGEPPCASCQKEGRWKREGPFLEQCGTRSLPCQRRKLGTEGDRRHLPQQSLLFKLGRGR